VPDEIHQVRGILAIVDRESRIEADLVGMFTLNRGSLNSAHIHGTDVPVEEPSTASIPDVTSGQNPTGSVSACSGVTVVGLQNRL
jgi:hypothetical protein